MNEEKKYHGLKKSITMMKSQSDIERNKLIENGKRMVLIKLLNKMKELIISKLKYKYMKDIL